MCGDHQPTNNLRALRWLKWKFADMLQKHGNLNAPANYARFVLPDLFPTLEKVLWVDGDTIIKCDVVPMIHNALKGTKRPIAAVSR